MAKCKGCGVELLDGTVFCPYCGAQVESEQKDVETKVEVINNDGTTYVNENPATSTYEFKENGAFKVFALLGMIFGIVSLSFILLTLICSGVPEEAWYIACFGVEFAIPGFIFSIIGKRSVRNHGKAVFGFVANLVGMIILFILAVSLIIIAMLEGGYDPSYGVYY